jgi:hypothetical protein
MLVAIVVGKSAGINRSLHFEGAITLPISAAAPCWFNRERR